MPRSGTTSNEASPRSGTHASTHERHVVASDEPSMQDVTEVGNVTESDPSDADAAKVPNPSVPLRCAKSQSEIGTTSWSLIPTWLYS